jgi:hypothetical protein
MLMRVATLLQWLVQDTSCSSTTLPVVIFSSSACIGLAGLAGVISALSKMQGIEAVLAAIAQVDRAMRLSHAPARGIRA